MADLPNQAMTVRDIAGYLNVNEKTVYRLAQCGELPGFKVAGAWRFQPSDLDEWINLQKKVVVSQAIVGQRGTYNGRFGASQPRLIIV